MANAWCSNINYCPYKSDTGYCGYTGMGCHLESTGSSIAALNIPQESDFTIVRTVELSDESIAKIVDSITERLSEMLKLMEDKLVRCKDCKWNGDSLRCPMCSEGLRTQDDWYCGDGKRRSE